MICKRRTNPKTSRRSAAALVEVAVSLPALFLILLASIQAADVIFLKQTLHVASYEAIRAAIKRRATNQQAIDAGEQILIDRHVQGFNITLDPANVEDAVRGEEVAVTVDAPAGTNTVLPSWFFGEEELTVTTKMVKE